MRIVSNNEFESAMANVEYLKIISSASKGYAKYIDRETFLRMRSIVLWETLRDYEPEKCKFTSLLYNRIRWECKKICRGLKKERERNSRELLSPNLDFFLKDTSVDMQSILEGLSSRDHKLIVDKFVNNKTLKEIGTESNISPQAVHNHLKRIYKKIRETLS